MIRKILSWIAFAICEAVMITTFIIYGNEMLMEVMVLDIVVCTTVLGLFFIDVIYPWKDKYSSNIGSMGVRWIVTCFYALIALGSMIIFKDKEFITHLLIQSSLIAILIFGFVAIVRSREQIKMVSQNESKIINNRDNVRNAWANLLMKIDMTKDFPVETRNRVSDLSQNLRYLTPTNNVNAQDIDYQLVDEAEKMTCMLMNYNLNKEQMEYTLTRCELLLRQRNMHYSE